MNDERQVRRTVLLGGGIALAGLLCLVAGIVLLAWRLIQPGESALLPPGLFETPESTPTPGVLGTPLPPPPAEPGRIVMLPVSERPTSSPTATLRPPTAFPTSAPTASRTPIPPPALTDTHPAATQTLTASPTRLPPTLTLTTAINPSPTGTPSHLPTPAVVSPPTPTARPPTIPQRIVIESIGLDALVVPVGQHSIMLEDQLYSQWDVPNRRAAGWHESSAPLGQPGNTVINGHHNTSGEVFRYLVTLKPGDVITIESAVRRYHYVVVQTMTLAEENQPIEARQENARWILPTRDERVTLITCWPYDANTHRLVVIAVPIKQVIPPAGIP